MARSEPSSHDPFLEKIKSPKIGLQGNNPHIFLWHLYDQKSKKNNFFFSPTDHQFGTHKKMPLKFQAKTKPSFP